MNPDTASIAAGAASTSAVLVVGAFPVNGPVGTGDEGIKLHEAVSRSSTRSVRILCRGLGRRTWPRWEGTLRPQGRSLGSARRSVLVQRRRASGPSEVSYFFLSWSLSNCFCTMSCMRVVGSSGSSADTTSFMMPVRLTITMEMTEATTAKLSPLRY